MYNINKFPVIILSAPRTGCTSLAYDILETHPNLKLFNEPHIVPENFNAFNEVIDNTGYLLKVHLLDAQKKYQPKLFDIIKNKNAFVIRIRRNNLLEQITSYYIELHRNIWGYYKSGEYTQLNDSIPFDEKIAKYAIVQIIKYNRALDNFQHAFDLDLYYEDLKFINNQMIPTPKPNNYNEIVTFIKERLPKL